MITIAQCLNLGEAQQLKTRLEAEGISAFIPDEMSAGVAPHHFLTTSGVRLQVDEKDAEAARELISDVKATEPEKAP